MMIGPILDANALGRAARFDELLGFLRNSNYSDAFICERLHLERAEDFELDSKKRDPLPLAESPADILLALFLAGNAVRISTARSLLGDRNIELLGGMGLLAVDEDAHLCSATAALYPVEDIYIASDRWNMPDGSPLEVPDDTVYPAFIPNTRLFVRHLPHRPGAKYLDLCAGTGIAALWAASRGAGQAWSGDIADRSSQFAEFNRRLNALPNVHVITSDLYKNMAGLRFDVISAHPPYVPTLQPKWIFFSGGRDGEEITRRIIEGVPDHLEQGGSFIALTMGGDRKNQPFEYRIREWLGTAEGEFDIAFLVRKEMDPQEFALRANRETLRTREESELWDRFFRKLQVTSLSYGFICIQRRSGAGTAFTVRRQTSSLTSRDPWEWLFRWEAAAHGERMLQLILDSTLLAAKEMEFQVLHRLNQGTWMPSNYSLRIDYPFSMECEVQPWMAHFISLCDGRATGRDAFRTLIQNGILPESIPESEFAQAAASLISGGFIEVEGFEIRGRTTPSIFTGCSSSKDRV
jgi:methylase of polypeptide subunit release factors